MAVLSFPRLPSGKAGARQALLRVSVLSAKGKKEKMVVVRGDSPNCFIHPAV